MDTLLLLWAQDNRLPDHAPRVTRTEHFRAGSRRGELLLECIQQDGNSIREVVRLHGATPCGSAVIWPAAEGLVFRAFASDPLRP